MEKKMKAALLKEPLKLAVEEVPKPIVGRNDVLVEVRAVGVCGTDVETYRGNYTVKYPIIMGHEAAGQIVEVGQNFKDVHLGDRVIIDPIFHCGKCSMRSKGKTNLCEHGGLLGREIGDGA